MVSQLRVHGFCNRKATRLARGTRLRQPERVAGELKQRIATGVYATHSFLPSERALADELNTSRNTLRAALSLLEKEKYILRSQSRGVRVLPPQDRLAKNRVGVVYQHWMANPPELTYMLAGIQDCLTGLGYRYDLVPIGRDRRHTSTGSEHVFRPQPSCTLSPTVSDPVACNHGQASPQESDHRATSMANLEERFGAVVFVETFRQEAAILNLHKNGLLVAVANLETDIAVSGTWVDHRKTTSSAVNTLVALGHRRIALLARAPEVLFYGQVHKAYKTALAEAGIPLDPRMVAVCDETDDLAAYFAVKPLIDCENPPTAVVAARDVLAKGACGAYQERGMRIGDDVSIIGFDDVSWPHEAPFLTTFREPCYEMGRVAAEMLVEKIVHNSTDVEKRELEAPFVLRQSAGLKRG